MATIEDLTAFAYNLSLDRPELVECQKQTNIQDRSEPEDTSPMRKQYRRIALWLVTSCWKMDLSGDALCLALAVTRSYLSRKGSIDSSKQQLLASISLLISCKYLTSYPILTMRWACDTQHRYRYTEEDARIMEADILEALDYNLEISTVRKCYSTNFSTVQSKSERQQAHLKFWMDVHSVFSLEVTQMTSCEAFEELFQFVSLG